MEMPNKPSLSSLLGLPRAGQTAQAAGRTLNSCRLGLLPVINRLLERLQLEPLLRVICRRRMGGCESPQHGDCWCY